MSTDGESTEVREPADGHGSIPIATARAGGPMVRSVSGTPRRRRRFITLAIAVTLSLVVIGLAHRPILKGFALSFRVDDPAPGDVLVLLTGGESDRARRTAELYQRGFAPIVLVCSDADTETNVRDLVSAGVPAAAIRRLGTVTSTYDEAVRLRDDAAANSVRRITAVTTAYHTRRARWILGRVFRGTGVEVHMAASDDARFDESNWYRNPAGRRFYFNEVIKLLYYYTHY
jgi:uncharacterized SAM-binding protein YcdF (DUF218 family)